MFGLVAEMRENRVLESIKQIKLKLCLVDSANGMSDKFCFYYVRGGFGGWVVGGRMLTSACMTQSSAKKSSSNTFRHVFQVKLHPGSYIRGPLLFGNIGREQLIKFLDL